MWGIYALLVLLTLTVVFKVAKKLDRYWLPGIFDGKSRGNLGPKQYKYYATWHCATVTAMFHINCWLPRENYIHHFTLSMLSYTTSIFTQQRQSSCSSVAMHLQSPTWRWIRDLVEAVDSIGIGASESIGVSHCRQCGRSLRTQHKCLAMILQWVFIFTRTPTTTLQLSSWMLIKATIMMLCSAMDQVQCMQTLKQCFTDHSPGIPATMNQHTEYMEYRYRSLRQTWPRLFSNGSHFSAMTDCSLRQLIFSRASRKYSSAFSYLHNQQHYYIITVIWDSSLLTLTLNNY